MNRPVGYEALPRRFRDHITALENTVETLRKSLPSKEPTPIKIENYTRGDVDAYLPDQTRISFTLPTNERFEVSIRDGELQIMLGDFGGMAVLPRVSNVIALRRR